MISSARSLSRQLAPSLTKTSLVPARTLTSHASPQKNNAKKEGDISSVFVSLSGAAPTALPERFAEIKRQLLHGHEDAVVASWQLLLERLNEDVEIIAEKGGDIVPQIYFEDLQANGTSAEFQTEVRKRGVAVIRGVVPETEARGYKTEIEEYVRMNPWTKAFPAHNPAVFELYWSAAQVRARGHSNLISTQRYLMNLWHSKDNNTLLSTSLPLAYADRVRIRQPGDAGFALGPHIDGGSVERWEPHGYGRGGVYDRIFEGAWEDYDAWESSCRVPAVMDNYDGAGSCSMFRMFQGWMSMSRTGPHEGTLQVNPLLQLSTAYTLLRPFFTPVTPSDSPIVGKYSSAFLHPSNWRLADPTSTDLQGASPGHGQELNHVLHPHLDLPRTMIHIPRLRPGDYVAWHCDTIHAVDKVHLGTADASVLYIPVCPLTVLNASYLARQRETFLGGYPGPDFPGGRGESEHLGRPTLRYLEGQLGAEALQAMGLQRIEEDGEVAKRANQILGFS